MAYYEGTNRKNKASFIKPSKKNYCHWRCNSQMNLMLSSQISGVNWQVKLQMLQEPSNPTYTNQNLAWKQNNSGLINYKMIFSLWKLTKVPVMTSVLMILKNVLVVYVNLWSMCLSMKKGIFPDDLDIAKVTPDYKADDKSDLSSYRPIPKLSCLSKISNG